MILPVKKHDLKSRLLRGETSQDSNLIINVSNERAWGGSIVYPENTQHSTKIHFIDNEPSVQIHHERDETYTVITGEIIFFYGAKLLDENGNYDPVKTMGNLKKRIMKPGDEVKIERGSVHVPVNNRKKPSIFLEVSYGEYKESDIERIYDKNRRNHELVKLWEEELGFQGGLSISQIIELCKQKLNKK